MNPFMISIRVVPLVYSPTSSSFIMGYHSVSCVIISSALPLICVGRSSSSSVSNSLASYPPSVSSGIVASAPPCCFLSLLHYGSSLRRVLSSDSRRSLRYVPVYPLPISSHSLTTCMDPSMIALRPEQRFTLLHASLACTPPAWRTILSKKQRHTFLIPTGHTTGHLSRATRRAAMMAW